MIISSNFDSGNIIVDSISDNSANVQIRQDSNSEFYQWFHFRAANVEGQLISFNVTNAGQSSYVEGWEDYQAVASYDREDWFRVDTSYSNGTLSFSLESEYDSVYFAYFAPYSYDRHLDLVHGAQLSPLCKLTKLGHSVDGNDIDMLTIGEPSAEKSVAWVIARQHPGESMAEWWMEGFISKLLDEDDGIARALLNQYVFYVVPNMNPDGSIRGNLRANAAGRNLNREWADPCPDNSPEVFHVFNKMKETGVDLFLDVHGDEAIPYNFLAGNEGIPCYDDRLQMLETTFSQSLLDATPEFQVEHGYPKDEPGQANLTIACCAVGETFKCLAYTLEMPFKDHNLLVDPVYGWSPARSMKLGEACLQPILAVANKLR
jgi:murein tripeptide amidase MpaA